MPQAACAQQTNRMPTGHYRSKKQIVIGEVVACKHLACAQAHLLDSAREHCRVAIERVSTAALLMVPQDLS